MCGINGRLNQIFISEDEFKTLRDLMKHRGPDDAGVYQQLIGKYQLFLGHRRLSIIDLSSLGHQPMKSSDGNVIIVFNGEIYNYLELKQLLISLNHSFYSKTDTEVIVEAYLEWGEDCFKKLNGMFAIALFDKRTEKLYLVRDRAGKKPLYYYEDGQNFSFASELKPIIKDSTLDIQIDKSKIPGYLYHHYVSNNSTVITNIKKVPAGGILQWDKGKVKTYKYWDLPYEYSQLRRSQINDYGVAKNELKELVIDSVQRRLIADVPVGVFLSGGIDSSLVAAVAQKITNKNIKTFCIGFESLNYDEAPYAEDVAKYLGTDHHSMYLSNDDVLEMLNDLPKYFDEPMADSSQIPTMLVSKLASEDVTVVLSGDGGDEIFGGYNDYIKIQFMQEHAILIKAFKKLYPKTLGDILPRRLSNLLNQVDYGKRFQTANGRLCSIISKLCNLADASILFDENGLEQINDKVLGRMLLDMQHYLLDDILIKTDRACMKYSIEARCPLLDYRIIEHSFKLPMEYKLNGDNGKMILKDVLYDYIDSTLFVRPKHGFSFPINEYLFGALKEELYDLSAKNFIKNEGLFNYDCLINIIKYAEEHKLDSDVYSGLLWSYYVFQKWYYEYMYS